MAGFDKDWKIDKHIPLALLAGFVVQFVGYVWYAAKVDAIVQQVPAIDKRVSNIEITRFTNEDAERWHHVIVSEIKAELAPIVEKVKTNAVGIEQNRQEIKELRRK